MTQQEIAEKIGIHRITVQNYLKTVGFMSEEDRSALIIIAVILIGGATLLAWLNRNNK